MNETNNNPEIWNDINLARMTPAGFAFYASGGQWKLAKHLALLNRKLVDLASGRITRLMVNFPPRHGKQINNDVLVLTTEGWKRHGDLHPGDYVFGLDGSPKKVLAQSLENEQDYELVVDEEFVIPCHKNHEWYVFDRVHKQYRIMETWELANRTLCYKEKKSNGRVAKRYPLLLDYTKPLEFEEKILELHPYILGAWLGDGTTDSPTFSYSDKKQPIIDEINNLFGRHSSNWTQEDTGVHYCYYSGMIEFLRNINVFKNKHVPEQYLYSSIEQRLQLLAGLIDTDGYVDKKGKVVFSNTNKDIIDAVVFIVRSLGMHAGIEEVPAELSSSGIQGTKTVYRVLFSPHIEIPTRVPEKKITGKCIRRRRAITSINRVETSKGKCIQVEGDGIYLVGEDLIPTHNSELISKYFPAWYLGTFPDNKIIFSTYEASFAAQFGAAAREIFEENGEKVFGLKVDEKSFAASHWKINKHQGSMTTAGVGGPITGKGANCLIIDDPIKNDEEANSLIMQEKLWAWFGKVAYTRLQPGGNSGICLIMTRWSCFHPDTEIFINDKLTKIKDARISDNVLTSKGLLPIEGIASKHYSGKVLSIKTWYNSTPAVCTPEHKFLTLEGWKEAYNLTKEDFIYCPIPKTEETTLTYVESLWPEAPKIVAKRKPPITGQKNKISKEILEDLLKNKKLTYQEAANYLGYKSKQTIYEYATLYGLNNIKEQFFPKSVVYDPLFWRVVGYWLAEGSITYNRKGYENNVVCFAFHKDETTYHEDIERFVKKYGFNITRKVNKHNKGIVIQFCCRQFCKFIEFFGTSAENKIIPEWVVNLPKELLYELLLGYWRGDGAINESNGRARFRSVSKSLLYNIHRSLLRFNVVSSLVKASNSGQEYISGRLCNRLDSYELYFPMYLMNFEKPIYIPDITEKYAILEENNVYIKIKSITEEQYNGLVYDIQTPAHDFIVNYCTVHNCGDLAGRLLEAEKSGGDKWEKVIFPAIAEEDEPQLPQGMGRKKGEALWPEYWDLEKLNRIKNSGALSSYGWSALYQQSPAPEGGGIFKDDWFKYFFTQNDYYVLQGNEKKGDFSTQFIPFYKCWKLITVDTANKVNNTSDYTGIAVWAITPNRDLLLLETHYGRIPYDQIIPILQELNRMHKPQYIGIENTGVAIQLIIEARNKGLAVRALEPEGKGKQNRANTPLGAVVRMEAGKIYFNKSDANFDELKRQLLYFPKHTSDEFVDLLAYAANELTKSDMYDSQDFSPYSISDNLPIGIKKGNNTSSYFF